MTDVRNVARINTPSAAPYYNVEEEEAESDNKSGILKDSNDQEMKIWNRIYMKLKEIFRR